MAVTMRESQCAASSSSDDDEEGSPWAASSLPPSALFLVTSHFLPRMKSMGRERPTNSTKATHEQHQDGPCITIASTSTKCSTIPLTAAASSTRTMALAHMEETCT